MLKRMATWLALLTALGAGFLVGKATDTVFSGDGRLASDRSDAINLAVPTTPATEPPTTVALADTTPPELMIVNPTDGERVAERTYRFEGFTEPGASVAVGSYAATVGPDGEWSIVLKLKPGTNSITAVATDAAGNQSVVIATVIYDAPAPPPKEDKPACAQNDDQWEDACKPACAQNDDQWEDQKEDGCKPACAQHEGAACEQPPTSTPVEVPLEAPVVE